MINKNKQKWIINENADNQCYQNIITLEKPDVKKSKDRQKEKNLKEALICLSKVFGNHKNITNILHYIGL